LTNELISELRHGPIVKLLTGSGSRVDRYGYTGDIDSSKAHPAQGRLGPCPRSRGERMINSAFSRRQSFFGRGKSTYGGTKLRLDGKVAVVTGAGRGIGRAIALKLANEGAAVAIGDVIDNDVGKVVEEIQTRGGHASGQQCDVSKCEQAEGLLKHAIEIFGDLDILVNNAGINRDALLHKMTDEQWREVIEVDLFGEFFTTRFAAQHMRSRRKGRIINISSGSWQGNVGQANYAAAKAGVVGLTLTAARELAPKGVTANVICPGLIETAMARGMPQEVWNRVVGKIPMGRPGQPEDVASLVAFLASDEAGYVTGQIIGVAGGYIV
jgi:NAD(P)-dependent dehydrogenase (short-subunit alcohol dehydrogenase family)